MIIDNIWLALAIFLTLMGLAYSAARFIVEVGQARTSGRRWFMSFMVLATVTASVGLIAVIFV